MTPGTKCTTSSLCDPRGGPHPLWASLKRVSFAQVSLEVLRLSAMTVGRRGDVSKDGSSNIYLGRLPRA